MSLYVDSSALLKRYVDEPDSDACEALLRADADLVTGRHTVIEVRRNLARLLEAADLAAAREQLVEDLRSFSLVELDAVTCEGAATIAELTGVRTLDALHLACARRVGGNELPLLTYDLRQAQAARALGMTVVS
ncbi:MAG: type II toxin-antitoxin system VapC family toxin [Gaiellales bacterium]